MSFLLVEIGNTALKAAWAEGVVLGRIFRYQGEKTIDYIISLTEKEKPDILSVASVKPFSEEDVSLLESCCQRLLLMDAGHRETIKSYGFPEYLGFDRAASVIAARYLFSGKSCTIFDLGTTLTVDFMNADGSYAGGNISLGCRTRFKALKRYSKDLPLVNTPEEEPDGTDSLEASIESGVISGIMFEIEGYIRRHEENVVIFTGGDANYFAKRMKNPIFAVCNLVLMGLALITTDYVEKNFA